MACEKVLYTRTLSRHMAHADPEIDCIVAYAKMMRSRGVPGFDVENEHWRCGTLRVYMGISARDGRQIVYEFDLSRAPERPILTPADVLSGIAVLPRCVPGWKVAVSERGGIEFF
jgi:hypothetical protein